MQQVTRALGSADASGSQRSHPLFSTTVFEDPHSDTMLSAGLHLLLRHLLVKNNGSESNIKLQGDKFSWTSNINQHSMVSLSALALFLAD